MSKRTPRRGRTLLALLVMSSSLMSSGCDPTIRATVENGVINTSTAALASLFQAGLQLFIESRQDPNQT
jgi:hypothetical protein